MGFEFLLYVMIFFVVIIILIFLNLKYNGDFTSQNNESFLHHNKFQSNNFILSRNDDFQYNDFQSHWTTSEHFYIDDNHKSYECDISRSLYDPSCPLYHIFHHDDYLSSDFTSSNGLLDSSYSSSDWDSWSSSSSDSWSSSTSSWDWDKKVAFLIWNYKWLVARPTDSF